jgi:hypothetical protein
MTMQQHKILFVLFDVAVRKAVRLRRRLRRAFAEASYRPELHYMRGPGPKCSEKLAGGGGMIAAD